MPSRLTLALTVILIAPQLAGCGSQSLGSAFGPSLSETERVFLASAGTWDTNRDGQVTCAEWQGYLAELVAGADKSGDGALTPEEFATIVKTDRLFETADFAFWDTNRDGKITKAEMIEHPNPAFTLLDRDRDCTLSPTELSASRSLQISSIPTGSSAKAEPPPSGRPGAR